MNNCLLLSSVCKNNIKPFKFNSTGVNVFSLEEAMYYCYHHWNEVLDEFNSQEFITWVGEELNLYSISNTIKRIKEKATFSERLIDFLTIIYYFNDKEVEKIKTELFFWENRSIVEKLKEQADNLIKKEKVETALKLYIKAIEYEKENIKLINNIGVALMKKSEYKKALEKFKQAYNIDNDNKEIIFNLIECYIFNHNYVEAEVLLKKAQEYGESADLYYFWAEIYIGKSNYDNAIKYYQKSIELETNIDTYFKLADVFMRLRQFQSAVEMLDSLGDIDEDVLIKKSEIFIISNNVPAAIRSIEKALFYNRTSVKLWTMLATYYRLDYNLNKAEAAILKALNIKNDDENANMELAKIRKSQGKIKDYNNLLSKILCKFKEIYRELVS